jgi:hypothetical protein
MLNEFCEAYVRDILDSDGTLEDVSEDVIQREAGRLEVALYKEASQWADNYFDIKEG